jgi:hypothetical protein
MHFDTDLLDEYCETIYGHTNWAFFDTLNTKERKKALKKEKVVVFFEEPLLEEE